MAELAKIFNCLYIFLALGLSLIIRIILSIFKSAELSREQKDEVRFELWKKSFFSSANDKAIDDYWLSFWLGSIELMIYPYSMASRWEFIAFWIGIKTAVTWKKWEEGKDRSPYMRFLLGNALVISFSYVMYLIFIK